MKRGLDLKKVVLLGRTLEEYTRSFGLNIQALSCQSILDVAAGVSSFCAEATGLGLDVTSVDPIYDLAPEEIQRRCEHDLDFVTEAIGSLPVYRWDFYKDAAGMRQFREKAYKKFLAHYLAHRGERYLPAQLPRLPFADRQFDLALVSYFLFVYEDQLPYEFHTQSLREIMRVTTEARFYPIVTFEAHRSAYLEQIKCDPQFQDITFEEVPTDFEFLANSNSFLRVRRHCEAPAKRTKIGTVG